MFLQNHAWSEENIENDFKAAVAVATLILNETNRNGLFQKFVESEVCDKTDFKPRLSMIIGTESWEVGDRPALVEYSVAHRITGREGRLGSYAFLSL